MFKSLPQLKNKCNLWKRGRGVGSEKVDTDIITAPIGKRSCSDDFVSLEEESALSDESKGSGESIRRYLPSAEILSPSNGMEFLDDWPPSRKHQPAAATILIVESGRRMDPLTRQELQDDLEDEDQAAEAQLMADWDQIDGDDFIVVHTTDEMLRMDFDGVLSLGS